uniref:Uncharacterized protein n=1 Tax=Anguilla anguilla TaxID=7936 RepID=A0A0E9SDC8_ANGAN
MTSILLRTSVMSCTNMLPCLDFCACSKLHVSFKLASLYSILVFIALLSRAHYTTIRLLEPLATPKEVGGENGLWKMNKNQKGLGLQHEQEEIIHSTGGPVNQRQNKAKP